MRSCPQCRSIYTVCVDYCGIDGTRLVECEEDPLVDATVDRYRILQRIGEGAMGRIYRVAHTVLEHEYAMKILFGDLGADRRLVERFRREAKAISRMRHPNVVAVTDFGTSSNGLTFLVMELVSGRTLADLITEEAPFDPRRAADITRQIALGLAEAHRLELVHRDVKPSNIMVSNEDGLEFVKILDFGIVGLVRSRGEEKITGSGQFIGTPVYMAPEQALEASAVSPKADLYSLGVILYEMLSGRVPFSGDSMIDILMKHTTEPPAPLPSSAGLEILAEWLLEKAPSKRPQTADDVVAEIDRLSLARESDPVPHVHASTNQDTLELFVDEANLKLGDSKAALAKALRPAHAPTPALAEEAPTTDLEGPPSPRKPSSSIGASASRKRETAVSVHESSQARSRRSSSGSKASNTSYESLRECLAAVERDLSRAREDIQPDALAELRGRFEEMSAALRPGLHAYRYGDLAAKIAKLGEDLMGLGALDEGPRRKS